MKNGRAAEDHVANIVPLSLAQPQPKALNWRIMFALHLYPRPKIVFGYLRCRIVPENVETTVRLSNNTEKMAFTAHLSNLWKSIIFTVSEPLSLTMVIGTAIKLTIRSFCRGRQGGHVPP